MTYSIIMYGGPYTVTKPTDEGEVTFFPVTVPTDGGEVACVVLDV